MSRVQLAAAGIIAAVVIAVVVWWVMRKKEEDGGGVADLLPDSLNPQAILDGEPVVGGGFPEESQAALEAALADAIPPSTADVPFVAPQDPGSGNTVRPGFELPLEPPKPGPTGVWADFYKPPEKPRAPKKAPQPPTPPMLPPKLGTNATPPAKPAPRPANVAAQLAVARELAAKAAKAAASAKPQPPKPAPKKNDLLAKARQVIVGKPAPKLTIVSPKPAPKPAPKPSPKPVAPKPAPRPVLPRIVASKPKIGVVR